MKKKSLLLVMVMSCFAFLLGISFTSSNNYVFAETPTLNSITSSIYLQGTVVPLTNGVYEANFGSIQTPYLTYTVKTKISTSPLGYDDLDNDTKQIINSQIVWKIGEDVISFSNGTFTNQNYELTLQENNLIIKPLKSGTYKITTTLLDKSYSSTLKCNYATPNAITLENDKALSQIYENYEPITFTASLNYQDFLDPNANYKFNWYIKYGTNETKLIENQTQSKLTLDATLIKIGKITISVELDQIKSVFKSVELTITTEQTYTLQINVDGNIEQYLDQTVSPINFTASLPISTEYTVVWFMKKPNTNNYEKLATTNNQFTFNPLLFTSGEYKLFAQAIMQENSVMSEIISIKLLATEHTTTDPLVITKQEYNASTNVQGYKLSIDISKTNYSEEQIIWYINGTALARGSSFIFAPTYAGSYFVQAKLADENGNQTSTILTATEELNCQALQQTQIWIYISIAGVALVLICVASILISNKVREKIW